MEAENKPMLCNCCINTCPGHAFTLLALKYLNFLLYWKVNQCIQLVPHVSAVGKALQMNYQYGGQRPQV